MVGQNRCHGGPKMGYGGAKTSGIMGSFCGSESCKELLVEATPNIYVYIYSSISPFFPTNPHAA